MKAPFSSNWLSRIYNSQSTNLIFGIFLSFNFLISLAFLSGCKKDSLKSEETESVTSETVDETIKVRDTPVLHAGVRLIVITPESQADVRLLNDSILEVKTTSHLKGFPFQLENKSMKLAPKVGDVLIANRFNNLPLGLFAKVISVTAHGSSYTLALLPEKFENVFDELNINWAKEFKPKPVKIEDFKKEIPIGPQGVNLTLEGSYSIDIGGRLALVISNSHLKEASFSLLVSNSEIKLKSGLSYQENIIKDTTILLKEVPLIASGSFNVEGIDFPIVESAVLRISLKISAVGQMELSGEIDYKNKSGISVDFNGATFDADGSVLAQSSLTDTAKNTSKIEGTFTAGIATDIKVNFFNSDFLGLTAGVGEYNVLDGKCTTSGLEVTDKLETKGTVGGELKIFGQTLPKTFNLFDTSLILFKQVSNDDPRFCTGSLEPPTGIGGSHGDVHVITPDHQYYDQQACGEFTAIASSFNGLLVQIRQGPRPNQTTKQVTFNRAMAIRFGSDTINFRLEPFGLFVNRSVKDLSTRIPLNGNGYITSSGETILIQLASGDRINIKYYGTDYFDYTIGLIEKQKKKITGLLGNWNGNAIDDVYTSTGIINPHDFSAMYPAFPNSLRISQSESLFNYETGTSTATFTDYTYPSSDVILTPQQTENAQTVCLNAGITQQPALCNCIVDVGVTGDNWLTESGLFTQENFTSDNLLVHLKFDGNSKDQTGWKNDATLYGSPSFVTDRHGNSNSALGLDGKSFASIPNNTSIMGLNTSFTIAGWIEVDKWYGPQQWGLLTCKAAANTSNPLQIAFTPTFIGSASNHVNFNFSLNVWYHIAMVYQNGIRTYYINGQNIGSITQLVQVSSEPLDIGRDLYGATEYQIGAIDDYFVYNRILSDNEIMQLANK